MTVENCLKLLKLYKENGNEKGYANMLEHIKTGRKFQGLDIFPKETEVKDEKPKRRTKQKLYDNKPN